MFGNVTNAFYQIYFTYRGLFGWLNWQAYISNVFFRPVLFLLIFTLVGRFARDPQAAERYIIGMSVFAVVWMLSGGILSGFANERSFGTLPYIFSSRGSRLVHYFSRGVLHYPNGLISFVTCLIVAWLLLDLDLSRVNWLASLSAVFLIAASSTAFMLLMGSVSLVYRDWFKCSGDYQRRPSDIDWSYCPHDQPTLLPQRGRPGIPPHSWADSFSRGLRRGNGVDSGG